MQAAPAPSQSMKHKTIMVTAPTPAPPPQPGSVESVLQVIAKTQTLQVSAFCGLQKHSAVIKLHHQRRIGPDHARKSDGDAAAQMQTRSRIPYCNCAVFHLPKQTLVTGRLPDCESPAQPPPVWIAGLKHQRPALRRSPQQQGLRLFRLHDPVS